jgi:hypothetical protein
VGTLGGWTLRSYYEENPAALQEAVRRKEFTEELLADTGLSQIVGSDPERPGEARAKRELLLVLERAWLAVERTRQGAR